MHHKVLLSLVHGMRTIRCSAVEPLSLGLQSASNRPQDQSIGCGDIEAGSAVEQS